MILVDTSVWVDHFRSGDVALQKLLQAGQVATHPFVVGELACGNLKNRSKVLDLLQSLSSVEVATNHEALFFIEKHNLEGKGKGFIDVHLLAASFLSHVTLWTKDIRLGEIAKVLGVKAHP